MWFSGLSEQERHGEIYGGWSNTYRRFIRWRDKGIWEKPLEILIDDPDYEWLMIDARVRQKGAQHQDTSGRGCAWYAGQNPCYTRYHC